MKIYKIIVLFLVFFITSCNSRTLQNAEVVFINDDLIILPANGLLYGENGSLKKEFIENENIIVRVSTSFGCFKISDAHYGKFLMTLEFSDYDSKSYVKSINDIYSQDYIASYYEDWLEMGFDEYNYTTNVLRLFEIEISTEILCCMIQATLIFEIINNLNETEIKLISTGALIKTSTIVKIDFGKFDYAD